jgi:hypothetical protein
MAFLAVPFCQFVAIKNIIYGHEFTDFKVVKFKKSVKKLVKL